MPLLLLHRGQKITPTPLSKEEAGGTSEPQGSPALPPQKARVCYLDLDDGWKPGPQKVGTFRKLLPDQEAAEAGLEPDDEAHVGLPELLAVIGSGDRGDS